MERPSPHRWGKDLRERALGALLLVLASPLFLACATAIKLEGLVSRRARGPVLFAEDRVSQGRVIKLLKFRTLTADALAALPPGPTHIKHLENDASLTRTGRVLKQWYLDELPQLINVVRGEMALIGTRPWPLDIYEAELARGIMRKRDMPAGLIGPVQAQKGADGASDVDIDNEYWDALRTYSGWQLLKLDIAIIGRSIKVFLEHKGL
ncbi:MAG TPA: sugar transferase [Actinomycetota bacterium]|nr:sugar transferase [Actinomycetota bacterium]